MKVFEVTTELTENNETRQIIEYVTSDDDKLCSVFNYYVDHCKQYELELVGIREVITIVNNIKVKEE